MTATYRPTSSDVFMTEYQFLDKLGVFGAIESLSNVDESGYKTQKQKNILQVW